MLRTRPIRVTALLLAGLLLMAACGDDGEGSIAVSGDAPTTTTAPPVDIVATAEGAGGFTTLLAALDAADLTETLEEDGPFTVFAPTDEAFEAALVELGVTADELLADTEQLTSILTYHVIEGEVPAEEVVTLDGEAVPTLNGASVTITVDGDTVMVNDATVVQPDVVASNGTIHVIDAVLVPPA